MEKLHPITLAFPSPEREEAFRADYFRRSSRLARGAVVLGILQFALFGILDQAMVPESAGAALAVRAVVCALLVAWLGFSFSGAFNARTMQPTIAIVPMVAGFGVAVLALVAQDASGYYDYYAGMMLVLFYVHALLRLRFVWASGTSMIIIGVFALGTGALLDTPTIVQVNNTFFLLSANLTGMIASYALEFYARRIYAHNLTLKEQQERLAAEDARKGRELEAARRLQLNTLPTVIPDHPKADWAASMRPATEVGGDYYDWDVAGDGTLTLTIGDATGHGVQAGALVTAAQTVFSCFRRESDLGELLQQANSPLRRVGGGRLFMALAVARLKDDILEVAGAGMPPALVVRSANSSMEVIDLKGLPLGSPATYPYATQYVHLDPGDTVIFMTDGLPELFDADGQMFGYERAQRLAGEVAGESAAAVVRRLHAAARRFRGERPPNDDVTFLVLRRRPVHETLGEARKPDGLAVLAEG